jgi:hypothetical protein
VSEETKIVAGTLMFVWLPMMLVIWITYRWAVPKRVVRRRKKLKMIKGGKE